MPCTGTLHFLTKLWLFLQLLHISYLVINNYSSDPRAQELLQQLAVTKDYVSHYSLQQGIIEYKNKIWLGATVNVQYQVYQSLHERALEEHSGFPVTYARIKQLFFWPNMKSMIKT
jgi:hypothetical protein